MKELSIEEKVKRYDEALQRTRKWYDSNTNEGFRRIFEDIFPELAESKDERIRQFLIHEVTETSDEIMSYRNMNKKDVLAWLEEKGKQKPTDIQSIEKRAHEVFPDDDDENTPLYRQAFIDGAVDYIDCGCKNTAWSEEDENAIQVLKDIVKHSNEINENIYTMPLKEKLYDWFKSLKDRIQPKQEWSEEDETNASYICASLDCYYRLRKERNNTSGQENLDKARNWLYNRLKSLRPQNTWKPSNEQMDALHYVTNFDYGGHKATLVSLYEQLKKLKE